MGRIDTLSILAAIVRAAAITGVALNKSRYIPRSLKAFVIFLIALNLRGFPFVWHFRMLQPWVAAALKTRFVLKTRGRAAQMRQLSSVSPLGRHPLDVVETWKSRAGLADSDYNGHLSNSSYPKNLDICRLNAAVRFFGGFVTSGGRLALAGTYHMFVREIPIHAEYEIHLYLAGWEESKWAYLSAVFVTRQKKSKGSKAKSGTSQLEPTAKDAAQQLLKGVPQSQSASADAPGISISDSVVVVPPVTESIVDSTMSTNAGTPSGLGISNNNSSLLSGSTSPNPHAAMESVRIPEGTTLHAVAVSQYCFKHGRITVPPRVAFIASGFGNPERWERLSALRTGPDGQTKMRNLMRGGWKTDEEGLGAGFWDYAEGEERGRKGGDHFRNLRFVMEGLADGR